MMLSTGRLPFVAAIAAILLPAPTAVAQRGAAVGRQGTSLARPTSAQRAVTLPLILAIEDARAPTDVDFAMLLEAARVEGPLQISAIRALGRLERRDAIATLLPLLTVEATRAEAANAAAQALRGRRMEGVPDGRHEQAVLDALLTAGHAELSRKLPSALTPVARSLGRLPFQNPTQLKAAEAFLRRLLETPFPVIRNEPHLGAARALESVARLNGKVAPLDEETIVHLRLAARTTVKDLSSQRRNALAALIAAQGVDVETLRAVAGDEDMEVRRLAMLSAGGAGSSAADDERIEILREGVKDRSSMVRLEAVRAWARRAARTQGCGPLLDAFDDKDLHVVLAAIDSLADQCADDSNVTDRLTSEARSPGLSGIRLRESHALVSLARRAPDRAELRLGPFVAHNAWQVRLYAARAASIIGKADVLSDLADDPDDNVAEAALPALRKLLGAESDAAFVAALNRRNKLAGRSDIRPYQVIRTAAIALDGATSTPALVGALADALERISAEQCETSRDVRLALIARLGALGSESQAATLTPLLRDIDPVVAHAAAQILERWTGKPAFVDIPLKDLRVPSTAAIDRDVSVVVDMESGKSFEIRFNNQTPLTKARFLELVEAPRPYYDGLTFHRIASNFVVQGGGPNANEYCGACPFMRDEVGLAMNTRGSIGISTRGRDTGDAQIFINLVDSPRLDHNYTVFATVCRDSGKDGMEVVDSIQEGDRMVKVRAITPEETCK
jgi:cyclophilin family peptidyl-prolyl cis-trans isomerase